MCAFALSLPPALVGDISPERFFIYGVAVVLFIKMGRLPAVLALLAVFFSYGYFDGLYSMPTSLLVQSIPFRAHSLPFIPAHSAAAGTEDGK